MKLFIAALFSFVFVTSALADEMLYRSGNNTVHLTLEPCRKEILVLIKPDMQVHFNRSVVKNNGVAYIGCWAIFKEYIFLQFEDNSSTVFPAVLFKLDRSI
jgi:hypothetical protein